MSIYYLDTQAYLNPYNPPPLEQVILSIQNAIPDSSSMIVQPLRKNLEGVYKITIDNENLHDSVIPIHFPGKDVVDIPLEGNQLPVVPDSSGTQTTSGRVDHSFFKKNFAVVAKARKPGL